MAIAMPFSHSLDSAKANTEVFQNICVLYSFARGLCWIRDDEAGNWRTIN